MDGVFKPEVASSGNNVIVSALWWSGATRPHECSAAIPAGLLLGSASGWSSTGSELIALAGFHRQIAADLVAEKIVLTGETASVTAYGHGAGDVSITHPAAAITAAH
jgi:hypothetical protein